MATLALAAANLMHQARGLQDVALLGVGRQNLLFGQAVVEPQRQ